jgi:hypothetical protein
LFILVSSVVLLACIVGSEVVTRQSAVMATAEEGRGCEFSGDRGGADLCAVRRRVDSFSDSLVALLLTDPEYVLIASTLKGWAFVG